MSVVLLALLLSLSFSHKEVFTDSDVAWHIATGDLMWQEKTLTPSDPWSFSATGERLYNLSWLFEAVISILRACGGFTLLYALTILVYAGMLTCMACYCAKRGADLLAVLLITFFAMLALYGGINLRPNMCSLCMAIAFYVILMRHVDSGRLRDLMALPLLMILWVNLHGGFLLGFVLTGNFLLTALLQQDRRRAIHLIILLALFPIVTLINPDGYGMYYGAYKCLGGAFAKTVSEWQPVNITHNAPVAFLLLLLLFCGNVSDTRIALADRLLSILITMMSLSCVRYSLFMGLLLMPTLSLRLTFMLRESRFCEGWNAANCQFAADLDKPDLRIFFGSITTVILIFLCVPSPLHQRLIPMSGGFNTALMPVKEAAFIEKSYPALRFMNDYNLGGYLIYLWRGKVKLFVDSRANTLYSDETLKDYTDFVNTGGLGARAHAIAEKYHFDGLILANTMPNTELWSANKDWVPVYKGDVATVYLKNKKP